MKNYAHLYEQRNIYTMQMNKIKLCNLVIVEKYRHRILFINYSSILTDNFSQNPEKPIAFSVKKKKCVFS